MLGASSTEQWCKEFSTYPRDTPSRNPKTATRVPPKVSSASAPQRVSAKSASPGTWVESEKLEFFRGNRAATGSLCSSGVLALKCPVRFFHGDFIILLSETFSVVAGFSCRWSILENEFSGEGTVRREEIACVQYLKYCPTSSNQI